MTYITPDDLLQRYATGERNFAGVQFPANSSVGAFQEANLSDIILSGVNLESFIMDRVNLSGAKMVGTYLFRSRMNLANLRDADLTGANFVRASLWKADLTDADLTGATLVKTDLFNANLTRTLFQDSLIFQVNLAKIILPEGQPRSIRCPNAYVGQTTMPDGNFEAAFKFIDA
ncbi:pentapeptide repeat-containing protein [Pleurocapsa sp. FMAR1]|uniref:pentapeptide repeat-containing protein n=1 Tax=Pleurocapsa sp. FMAR1 TaxID=3040204 RepID=UPI0029C7DD55|nr:pentapeptide repeat-containing protein [Pleurocapsa sp. FMAR1]